jgi:hypothetical protein
MFIIATAVTSFIIGAWFMSLSSKALVAHWQRWTYRKIKYWQERAMRAEDPMWRDPDHMIKS